MIPKLNSPKGGKADGPVHKVLAVPEFRSPTMYKKIDRILLQTIIPMLRGQTGSLWLGLTNLAKQMSCVGSVKDPASTKLWESKKET